MLRVPIENARSGMVLARSVANPQKLQHTLLKAGFTLDDETIEKLRKLHVYNCWVKYPKLDFLDEILDPELVHQQQGIYSSLKNQFSDIQDKSLAKVDYSQYVGQISKLFTQLLSQSNSAKIFMNELQGEAEDVFLHGTTVAYIAMLIGMKIENHLIHQRPQLPSHLATDLTSLGVGCLLHDIGKLSLPEDIRNFHLTAQDLGSPEWQKHTEAGYEMVRGGLDPCAAQVVLNHHQHYDGSGFPARKCDFGTNQPTLTLKQEEIHIFCRITTIADRFDGFRHMPDGTLAPLVVSLKRMQNPGYVKWFDPVIYPAFLQVVTPFPPGEQVVLNNGQLAVVTELNEEFPCKPVVRYIDPSLAENPDTTNTIEQPEINLALRSDLYIQKSGNIDITKYLYE